MVYGRAQARKSVFKKGSFIFNEITLICEVSLVFNKIIDERRSNFFKVILRFMLYINSHGLSHRK